VGAFAERDEASSGIVRGWPDEFTLGKTGSAFAATGNAGRLGERNSALNPNSGGGHFQP
jgi:hypothetical protein